MVVGVLLCFGAFDALTATYAVALTGTIGGGVVSSPNVDTCASIFQLFPQNGAVVNYQAGDSGFALYNFSLTTSFEWWSPWTYAWSANTSSWTPEGNVAVAGNVNDLTATNDVLTLTEGNFLFSANNSVDTQVTIHDAKATLTQHNSAAVAITLTASSFYANIGPVMAKVLKIGPIDAQVSNMVLTVLVDCSTGTTSYSFSGQMSGTGALSAVMQKEGL